MHPPQLASPLSQALAVNEFRGADFSCTLSGGANATNCQDGNEWLRLLNFEKVSVAANVGYLLALMAAFNLLAFYGVLVLRRPNFVKMVAPPGGGAARTSSSHTVAVESVSSA